jgi:hypothetical protein
MKLNHILYALAQFNSRYQVRLDLGAVSYKALAKFIGHRNNGAMIEHRPVIEPVIGRPVTAPKVRLINLIPRELIRLTGLAQLQYLILSALTPHKFIM